MPRPSAAAAVPSELSDLESIISQDPVGFALALGLAVLVIVGTAYVIRWLRRPPGQRLKRAISDVNNVTILMHPNPDPDAMAASLGISYIAEANDVDATIQYTGQIRHPENRAFSTVLGLEAEEIDSVEELACETVILVDHNKCRGFDGSDRVKPYAVIDHHPGDGDGSAFTDIRTDYGACSSMVTEYFMELGAEPVISDGSGTVELGETRLSLPSPVATGLLYGILADTGHLTRGCSRAEFDASAYLYPGVDEDSLNRIANPEIDAEVLDVTAKAIMEREVRGPYTVSDIGSVSNVDAIPEAADELLVLEGVTAVIVLGDKEDTLHLSGRSRDDRVHIGQVLERAVEDVPMSGAGGHARMGGGQVSLAHLEGIGPSGGFTRTEFRERLFDAMAGEI